MDSTSVLVFFISLALFAFFISIYEFDSLVKNYRAQVWIRAIAIFVCFWSIVAAVIIVGL